MSVIFGYSIEFKYKYTILLLLPFTVFDSILFACNIVMNFQTIRNDFNQQVKEQAEALEAEQMRAHLEEEMERQDRIYSKSRYKELLVFHKADGCFRVESYVIVSGVLKDLPNNSEHVK